MGKRAPSPPPAPDVEAIIRAQQQANATTARQNAVLNRTNQTTPFGSLSWQQTGVDPETGMPIWSSSVDLSPQQQQLLDQYQAFQGRRGQFANQLMDAGQSAMLNPLARMQGAPGIYMPNPQGGAGQWLGGPSPFGQPGGQGGPPMMPPGAPMGPPGGGMGGPPMGPPGMGQMAAMGGGANQPFMPGGAPGGKGAPQQPPAPGGMPQGGQGGAIQMALAQALRGGGA